MGLSTRFRRTFLDHPASVGETYFEHFGVAMRVAKELAGASAQAAVHALVPSLCCTSASDKIKTLHAEVTTGARGESAVVGELDGHGLDQVS